MLVSPLNVLHKQDVFWLMNSDSTDAIPKATLPADAELVSALGRGQTDCLDILYDRHGKLVFTLAYRILGSIEEAEDLTQDVFLSLCRRTTYDASRGSLVSFLVTFTRSRAIDKVRTRGNRLKILQRWQGNWSPNFTANSPMDAATSSEQSQRVRAALSQLSDSERQILESAYYDGLSQSEIAQKFNLPLGTVKSRSRQGLLKLRKALQADTFPEP
jgi:RNA polymerase sigma-70 factor, ECF subfamily